MEKRSRIEEEERGRRKKKEKEEQRRKEELRPPSSHPLSRDNIINDTSRPSIIARTVRLPTSLAGKPLLPLLLSCVLVS
ncbi:hypothetical protein E2C01_081698 [Portunus trituberculatus]|uniref:Uncharacterized protein n=1 Tax=Portunus trituberculatus TaxID=210409 RepID=A0A5B7IN44_PORTR|nr:hypothetical protein [Portunus trituberculatus]